MLLVPIKAQMQSWSSKGNDSLDTGLLKHWTLLWCVLPRTASLSYHCTCSLNFFIFWDLMDLLQDTIVQ